jgi:chromosome segregation ATPase
MNVTLDPARVQSLSSLPASLGDGAISLSVPAAPVLSGENVSVASASPDLESILATLRMETNEARLAAARSRLAGALTQLSGLSESEQAKVEEMKATGKDLSEAESVSGAAKKEADAKAKTVDSKKAALNDAEKAFGDAQKNVDAAQGAYDSAVSALEQYKNMGDLADPSELARLEDAVSSAKSNLDRAKRGEATARKALDSAQNEYDSAKKEYDAAMDRYNEAERKVNEGQSRFDALVDSLDQSSLTALRDALKLFAGDLDHLHDEIEEDDKKHSLASIRAVEDVIGDALKRLDGKMVDEIEDRHLDHV